MEAIREETTAKAGNALNELMQTYNYCMQRTLSKYGLYQGQPPLLFAIRDCVSPTQNELAQRLNITKASIGVSLRRMEKGGFVTRVRDGNDTRCNRVELTKKGAQYAKWCEIDFNMIHTTMLEHFDTDETNEALEVLKSMQSCLCELRDRIRM